MTREPDDRPQPMQPDVTYEQYLKDARQQMGRDRDAFTGEAPLMQCVLRERGAFTTAEERAEWLMGRLSMWAAP